MVIPQPWCTKDPRPCVKAVGLSEILIAVVGGVILVSLPFVVLDIDHEISYIKRFHNGPDEMISAISPENVYYVVNVSDIYRHYDCNQVAKSIGQFLEAYLKGKAWYNVKINDTKQVISEGSQNGTSTNVLCEIHVFTRISPRKDIIIHDRKKYSIARIIAQCLFKHTGISEDEELKKLSVIPPFGDQIALQILYPSLIGTDPERRSCINVKMAAVDKRTALDNESIMYHLLTASTATSLVAGLLLTSTGFMVSRLMLMVTFLVEAISIVLMIGGVYIVNDPSLCLYQYGGISKFSEGCPLYMQTIITYSCVIYTVSFKFYCIWFIMAYGEMATKLKEDDEPPDYSEYIADVAMEVDQRNQELGGDNADITDIDSDEDDNYDRLDDDGNNNNYNKGYRRTTEDSTISKAASTSVSTKPRSKSLGSEKNKTEDDESSGNESSFQGSGPNNNKRSGRDRSANPRKFFGPSHTLIPQKRDKDLFSNTFFGSNR